MRVIYRKCITDYVWFEVTRAPGLWLGFYAGSYGVSAAVCGYQVGLDWLPF